MKRIGFCLLIVVLVISGCTWCSRILDPGFDWGVDDQGNKYLRDTPRMWADFKEAIDGHVEDEKSGLDAPGGGEWSEFWTSRIHVMKRDHQENFEKYKDYIVQRRRSAGLPDLEGADE